MENESFQTGLTQISIAAVAIFLARRLTVAIYNLYFHPLRGFRGPWMAAATPMPFAVRLFTGQMVPWLYSLHSKYGEVVRTHPDELSFVGAAAWHDIYAARPEFPRSVIGSLAFPNGVRPLPTASIADHTRQKKIIGHAFSDRALREQEYLLHDYSDLLVARLQNQIEQGHAEIDICQWYNFTTFDIMGDLCFGQSFRCLERDENHTWIQAGFDSVKIRKMMTVFNHFSPLNLIVKWLLPAKLRTRARESFDWTRRMIDKRLQQEIERPDFLKYIFENNNIKERSMSRDEIDSTVNVLVSAGSGDTTSVALSTATYFALRNPTVLDELKREIDSVPDLTVTALSRLPFLHAVIQEALRIHPPVPICAPRLIDRPNVNICGIAVPQGCRVSIPPKVANRLPTNFVEADSFLPERWLKDEGGKFVADNKAVFEPFLVGPQKCLGEKLAWAEMKLIIAKLVRHFELALVESNGEGSQDWTDQPAYLVTEKKPLFVTIKPRKRE